MESFLGCWSAPLKAAPCSQCHGSHSTFVPPMLQLAQHLPISRAAGPPAAVQGSKAGQGVPAESPHPVSGCRLTCTLRQPLHQSHFEFSLCLTPQKSRALPSSTVSYLYQHQSHWQLWGRRPPDQLNKQPCRSMHGALLSQHCLTDCQIIWTEFAAIHLRQLRVMGCTPSDSVASLPVTLLILVIRSTSYDYCSQWVGLLYTALATCKPHTVCSTAVVL